MTTEEFDENRRKYIEKYGYTVTIPGPEDIFHFGTEVPLTAQEQVRWKKKDYNWFDPDRYEEIKHMKKRRKDQFTAMLSSPSPKILRSRAAIIGSIDDAQDALSTLAAIGTVAYYTGTAGVRKLIRGPLGWAITAANALNFVNRAIAPEQRMMMNKKLTEVTTKNNLKSSKTKLSLKNKMKVMKDKYDKALKDTGPNLKLKAKVLKARDWEMRRLKRIQTEMKLLKGGGWKGALIEALQVTDNVYGKGISLGALMNLPYDFISGAVRGAAYQKVHVKLPDIDVGHWGRVARKLVRDWLAFEAIPEKYRTEEHHSPVVITEHDCSMSTILSDQDQAKMRVALFLAQQTVHMTADQINPLEMDTSISNIELKAPEPTNILTLEVIEEAGDRPQDGCAWPATGEKWSNAVELIEESSKHITANMNDYAKRNNHSVVGWAVAQQSVDSALYGLESFAGTGTVQMEHTPSYRVINALQWLNFRMEDDVPASQQAIFAQWLQRCDDTNYTPSGREAFDFAQRHCGFGFVQA